MNYCLYCDEWIDQPLTWTTFFLPSDLTPLCETCKKELDFIKEPMCDRCGRQMEHTGICDDCKSWLSDPKYHDTLTYNRAFLRYNEFAQNLIARWKYRGDYHLREIFSYTIKKNIGKWYPIKELVIVPIPLTEERQWERAFNQSEAIAQLIQEHYHRPVCHIVERHTNFSEKQSKKSRQQRINSKNPFFLTKSIESNVLLVDDIYTTGMTIHHIASLLKAAGCSSIYSFTLIR